MIDFLRENPYVNRDEYMWEWTISQIRLASYDFTHVKYLSEKEAKRKDAVVIDTVDDLYNDLGIPINFNKE